MIGRRGFITGLATLFAAPVIVRASSLMVVKPLPLVMMRPPMAGMDLRLIKDLLLPGLREINGKYAEIPSHWDRLFIKT